MGRNNCCINFCVGLVVFLEFVGGLGKIIELIIINPQSTQQYVSGSIGALISMTSGLLLLIGAAQRKGKLIVAHLAIAVGCLVLGLVGLVILLCLTIENFLFILIIGSILVFKAGLEHCVYLFYKNMNSEVESLPNSQQLEQLSSLNPDEFVNIKMQN